MTHAERKSVKGRAFSLAVVVGLTVSGIGLVAAGAAAPPGRQACPPDGGGSVTPSVSAGQTATASPCPTVATTASPSATPPVTPTGSPTPIVTTTSTSTTTVTATADPTSTATPGPPPRTITLEANKAKTTFGKGITLSGGIFFVGSGCIASQAVKIFRTVAGSDTSDLYDSLNTDASGTFSKSYTADRSANYTAHVDASTLCAEADSAPVPLLVRVKVSLARSDPRVPAGSRVRLKVRVAPCESHAGDKVVLRKQVGGDFAKVDTKRLSNTCGARWRKRVTKDTAYQVRWPKQDPDHLRGSSRKKAVRAI